MKLVEAIYASVDITSALLGINPDLEDFEKLKSDLDEIGYGNGLLRRWYL